MEVLQLQLFGGFTLRRGDGPLLQIPSRVGRSLLAYLAIHRDTALSRDRLGTAIWPDAPEERAKRRLSHTLWQIQETLGEPPSGERWLDVTKDAVAFTGGASCIVDVEQFERGLDDARARLAGDTIDARGVMQLDRVLRLYRGDFLDGCYDEWALAEQERLGQRYLEGLALLVQGSRAVGAFDDALAYARRLADRAPLREDAHREVMRLAVLLGRGAEAVRQYLRCREVLADELGTIPSPATTRLYERIVAYNQSAESGDVPAEPMAMPELSPLVGRTVERDASVRVLDRALGGRGGAILVEAPTGYGKTRLLEQIGDDAAWRGYVVAAAVCPDDTTVRPYGVVRDLLESALTPLTLEQLRHRASPALLVQAARIVPALERVVPPGTRAPALRDGESAERLRDAVVRVLLTLAEAEPLLLMVDDLQGVDVESIEALTALAAGLPDQRVALALAYRGDELRAREAVWGAVREIDRRLQPARLTLPPLDEPAVTALARVAVRGQAVDPVVAARLHHDTGGNPLFVVETLRELVRGDRADDLVAGGEDPLPLPGSIRSLVGGRLERLTSDLHAVLDAVAVAGSVDEDTLATATGRPAADVAAAADRLVRERLLAPVGDGIGAAHDQIRRIVLERIDSDELRSWHLRLAGALEQHLPADVERLAHHWAAAGRPREAASYLRAAARAAADVHAYATADERYRQATDQRREVVGADATEWFDLLAEHEAVLDVLGERERQRGIVTELASLAGDDPVRVVEAARRQALLEGSLGELTVAAEAAARAVSVASSLGDATVLGPALLAQAWVLAWSGARTQAIEVLEDAVEVAEGRTVIHARIAMASVLRELPRYDEAVAQLRLALGLARELGEPREEAEALSVLGTVRMETGDSVEAETLYRRSIERCTTIGLRRGEGVNRVNLGNVLYVQGRVVEALDAYRSAAALFESLRDRRGAAAVRVNLGFVSHMVLGDDETALREVRNALDHFRESRDVLFEAACRDALASIARRRGDMAEAEQQLSQAFALIEAHPGAWIRVQLLEGRAELALARGDADGGLMDVAHALTVCRERGDVAMLPILLSLEAALRLVSQDARGAVASADEAVAALAPDAERAWVVHLRRHDALEAVGRHDDARHAIEEAARLLAAILDGLAPDDRERAAAVPEHRRILELRARGSATRPRARLARVGAPTGRPLRSDELIDVRFDLSGASAVRGGAAERRRWRIEQVLRQAAEQDAAPTIRELAAILGMPLITLRRDLDVLRRAGFSVVTRGSRGVPMDPGGGAAS